MSEKYVNHVNLATGKDVIDLRRDTVTEETMFDTVTAHDSEGKPITGKFPASEIDTQAELIEQIALTLQGKAAPSGGSGSGIIDVTELPTSNIDENAVYRLTEKVQLEKNEVYLRVYLNNQYMTITLQQYIASVGKQTVPEFHIVDDLSNMLETDVQGFDVVHIYMLRNGDGIAYVYSPYIPINNGIVTVGFLAFTSQGFSGDYDKGFTENADDIDEVGIYTTIEDFKDVVRYFIREGGEWKEVTAYYEYATPHGLTNVETISGDVTPIVCTASDILSGKCTEINESWFLQRDGSYLDKIIDYAFSRQYRFNTVTIPSFIKILGDFSFSTCSNLNTVTFKSKPNKMGGNTFFMCEKLKVINVPWSADDPINENQPWGASGAEIKFNQTVV